MIDMISTNENLVINKGEGLYPSPPPSSPGGDIKVNAVVTGITGEPPGAREGSAVQLSPGVRAKPVQVTREEASRDEKVEKELKETIKRLNDRLGGLDREVLLKMDERLGKYYVSVIDKASKEIIREFPPEEIRTFIARFVEFNDKLTAATDLRSLIVNLEV
jgi:uncharacterized FlaG/YvyC family protein